MPPRYPVRQLYPDITLYEPIAFDDLEDDSVRLGYEHWNTLRGARPYPSRKEIDARKIGRALSHLMLLEVIDHGADYRLRIVGDEVRRAYPVPLGGRLVSELALDLPKAVQTWRNMYRSVTESGCPIAMRVHVGLDVAEVCFSYAEGVCLPLGTPDNGVDHLITFASHVLEVVEQGLPSEDGHEPESAC